MEKPLHLDKTGQLCILSVDDDPVNLMVIEQLLKSEGWKIVSVVDGTEAMETLDEETWPDVVLLDYQLNVGPPGDQVCRDMRRLFGSAPIPIIMSTAMTAGSSAISQCMAAGATDYIVKPYERANVFDKIYKYVGDRLKASVALRPAQPASPPSVPAPVPNETSVAASKPVAQHNSPVSAYQPRTKQSIETFCTEINLEYCGKKLADNGVTLEQLKCMDDTQLRKAGIVVKAQRDKILEAVKSLQSAS